MVQDNAPTRRQSSGYGKMQRRKRIFARLREGASYEEIAGEECVSRERIRQIVSEVLQKRAVDSGADHAKLQLDRLAPLMQLAAESVASGDVRAITPYLRVLDRLDRYQTVAGANQVYDDEARKKLMDKINRMADNLGVDEVMWAAGRAHLIKIGQIPPDEPSEGAADDAPEGPDENDTAAAPANQAEGRPEGQSQAESWIAVRDRLTTS